MPCFTHLLNGRWASEMLILAALAFAGCNSIPTPTPTPAPAPSPTPSPAAEIQKAPAAKPEFSRFTLATPFENSLGMRFVSVPGTNTLFSIWDTRVQDYTEFSTATKWKWSRPPFKQTPTDPIVNMDYLDSATFCRWLTDKERAEGIIGPHERYRLPTDAEWSLAVGLGAETGKTPEEKDSKVKDVYPWGTTWPPDKWVGNFCDASLVKAEPNFGPGLPFDDGFAYTSPVGSFLPNRYGLYDMGGNVKQWCQDYFDLRNTDHVRRGGDFYAQLPDFCLSSARCHASGDMCGPADGFRCVLERLSEAEDRQRAHALAFGAILNTINESGTAKIEYQNPMSAPTFQGMLANSWGVNSRPDLLRLLAQMEEGSKGQRASYWRLFPEDVSTNNGVPTIKIAAWDFGRYVNLCYWGFRAGYLAEPETWDKIVPIARLLQRAYLSWEDYAACYIRGRNFWNSGAMLEDGELYSTVLAKLGKSPDGLWAKIPWNEPLGNGPVAVDGLEAKVREQQARDQAWAAQHPPKPAPAVK